jgi:hypothetical protein
MTPKGLESNTRKLNTLLSFKVFLPFGFCYLLALPTYQGKDIVFRFILEYSSLRDFGPGPRLIIIIIIIGLVVLYEDF